MKNAYRFWGFTFVSIILLHQYEKSNAFLVSCSYCCRLQQTKKRCNNNNNNNTPPLHSIISNEIDYSFLKRSNDARTTIQSTDEILNRDQIEYIDHLVERRSDARRNGDYSLADSIREEINSLHDHSQDVPMNDGLLNDKHKMIGSPFIIPKGFVVEIKDIPRKEGGGSTWTLKLEEKDSIEWVEPLHDQDTMQSHVGNDNSSVLKIAHSALGLASWSSENSLPINQNKLNSLVHQAKKRILKTGSRELRGRKAADAAFWFAMAGVKDELIIEGRGKDDIINFSLFDALTFICIDELRRFGKRSSCRATDIMHMVERIAASGVQSEMSKCLQKEAAECLLTKDLASSGFQEKEIVEDLQQGRFHLHSERSLLWIWRFSTRQRKQQAFLKSASKHWESKSNGLYKTSNQSSLPYIGGENAAVSEWSTIFEDPKKPLVLDIGCGMGISLLGLASHAGNDDGGDAESYLKMDWSMCNFLGVDLSQLAINYASSVSHRLNLKGRLHFEVAAAENIVEQLVKTYPGNVQLCMIQFPTPFSFQGDDSDIAPESDEVLESVAKRGNCQLPSSAISGFMVTSELLEQLYEVLDPKVGRLILQSNCEDVAVYMKNVATDEVGFQPLQVSNFVCNIEDEENGITMRTEKWIARGGERAEGEYWSSSQILPPIGATETEIACNLNGTPVHRCILQKLQ